ncbi:hypothetical protein [Salinirubrum litoreum]|uniref:Uncharacterized protein n=1 Tax=Salinirubrum litoreum TaxID=1126234 RepID=A0ABD5R9U2_9EURY|nr:hypothetical protein [Salinirubrum litoreum]
MRRRTALTATASALAGLTGLPGCLGAPESASTDETETTNTERSASSTAGTGTTDREPPLSLGESTTLPDGRTLTVADPTVQVSSLWYNGAFTAIRSEPGVQFLVVDVTGVEGSELDPNAFFFAADGELLEPAGRYEQVIPMGAGRESRGTLVAIPVPVAEVSSASVAYAPSFEALARWRLDDTTTAALASRPDLRVQVAELVSVASGVGLRTTVENAGDRDAVLRGLIEPNWAYDISDPVVVPVSAGESVTDVVAAPSLGYGGADPTVDDVRLRTEVRPQTRTFVVEYAATRTPEPK